MTTTQREQVNALSLEQFAALLRTRLGTAFGAAVCTDGNKRIWHRFGQELRVVTAPTWSAALVSAWRRWGWEIPGVK
jgi:hypothetical protein